MTWEIGGQALATYTGGEGMESWSTVGEDDLADMLIGYDGFDEDDDDDDDDDDDLMEMMGATDLVGRRGLGFLRRFMRKKKKKQRRRKKAKAKEAAQARVISQRAPTRNREWPVGFDSGVVIPAGQSQTVITQPQARDPELAARLSAVAGRVLDGAGA